ncbi:MAG: endolytic transglycosylase MltG [Muribaculaceae bacterium]|nr:endolytic transglycosylase MltG [Muribaculaceae bacterium]
MARKRKLFPIYVFMQIIGIPVALVFGIMLYFFGIMSPLKNDVVFSVNHGDTVSSVAADLEKRGIISSAEMFKVSVRAHGGRIQRGEYELHSGASIWRIAHILSRGEIATTTIIIPEGLTVKQIKNLLLNSAALTGSVECVPFSDAPVCDLHDGDLFPDTYRVAKGTNRLALLELMRKKMVDIEDAWRNSGAIHPRELKNWNEIVTLASIVQKETPRSAEMPIVASVYLNRLRKTMRLQADPTVVYALTDGLGDMQGAPLLRGHLKIESPYNTYRNSGLPPAPIANVGRAAIRAVLNPADTNYLFFVADGRGGHRFSNSYEEHLKNHADWRAIKKSRNGGN